jgi:hypothetical protein
MNASYPSPLNEPKTRLWVWVVPSLLLHAVLLGIWLLLPEEEARQPGGRKLTIHEEQAEELQERVEETNLRELREKVARLQSIKAAMVGIRDGKMTGVAGFEQTMVREAPQDVAALLRKLAGIYDQVYKDYETVETGLDLYREWQPNILKAADQDTIEALRILPNLKPYWDRFEGMADRFEVAFYETNAVIASIDTKLEWIDDPSVGEKISALAGPMETTHELHREAWEAVPSSWKPEQAFRFLTEDTAATIATIERFRKGEIDGRAEADAKRADLEKRIAEGEEDLARVDQLILADEAALGRMDRNKEREAWNAQRQSIAAHKRTQQKLANELRTLKRTLAGTQYKPDAKLARSVTTIESRLRFCLPEPPDPSVITRAMKQQREMIGHIEALAETLEVGP